MQFVRDLSSINFDYKLPCLSNFSPLIPKIEEDYLFNVEITKAIVNAFKFNKKLLIYGLHGMGKSSHIEQVAAKLNWPCFRINFDGYITRLDLIGKDIISLQDGKQVIDFQDGIIPWAIKQPLALILDEYDAARPEVMFILQRLLEKNGKFNLIEKNTIISPHPDFRIFATSNTIGNGDEYGIYSGTNLLNQAQLDRWDIILKMEFIPLEQEENLLSIKFPQIEKKIINQAANLASLTRTSFLAGDISIFMSHRNLINLFDNYIVFRDIILSFKYSFYNRCSPEEGEVIAEYFQRCFNLEVDEK